MKFIKNKFLILLTVFVVVLNAISPIQLLAVEPNTTKTPISNTGAIAITGGVTNSGNYTSEVTYSSADDSITYYVGIQSSTLGETVTITLPVGVDLVNAPGLEVNASGVVEEKEYQASTEATYFVSKPTYTLDSNIDSIATKSGTITYELNTVEGIQFTVATKVNTAFVPYSYESQTIALGQVKATLNEGETASVDVNVTSQDSELSFRTFSISEYINSTSSAYSQKLSSTFISADRTYQIAANVGIFMNRSMVGSSSTYRILNFEFDVIVPTGVEIISRTNIFTAEKISETDEYVTYRLVCTLPNNVSSTVLSFTDMIIFDFSNVEGNTDESSVYELSVGNVLYTVNSFNYENQAFEPVVITEENTSMSGKVYVSPLVDNDKYETSYTTNPVNTQYLNPFTGANRVLYQTRRSISTYVNGAGTISANTTEPIKLTYEAYPDEDKGYLDNVSSVEMTVPFLGEEWIERYAAQLESITIWYESDDIGELGITTEQGHKLDIDAFKTLMLEGKLTTSNSLSATIVDVDGIV